jgi:hypothetical protein
MKSRRGFLASIIFLAAIPAAGLYQAAFGLEVEAILHFAFAIGFAFISFSVFDFKLPKWINWAGCVSACVLAFIFLLQGISQLIRNDSLTYFAMQVLGQRLEARLVEALLLWFTILLFFDSRGRTRILGFVIMSAIACAQIYGYYLVYLGSSIDVEAPILKLLYLLPFVWLLFESKKKNSSKAKTDNL